MKWFKIIIILLLLLIPSFSMGARRALLIGVADYKLLPSGLNSKGKPVTDLRGPVNDVNNMKRALLCYGFKEKDIKILINSKATRQNIERVFRQWLIEGTRKGDLVVFYFSGHGSRVPDKNGDEADGKDEVILPYNAVPSGGENIIIDDELGLWLSMLKGRNVIVIIDSCYSGGVVRGVRGKVVSYLESTPATKVKFIPITNYRPTQAVLAIPKDIPDIPPDVIFLTASKEDEVALEVQQGNEFYGGFTLGLTKKMQTLKNPTYKELFEESKKYVWDKLKLPQNPQLYASRDIITEPAFGGTVSIPEVTPEPIPSHMGDERVLLAIDPIKGLSNSQMKKLKKAVKRLQIVKLVKSNAFFDRLLRGEKKRGKYYLRLLNRIGDVEILKPVSTIDEVIKELKKHLEYAYMVKQLARIRHPNPPFKVEIWVTDRNRRDFFFGEEITFGIRSERDAYILLINLDSEGNFHIIFPNKYHRDNFVPANTTVLIPDAKMRAQEFKLVFGPPGGEETVKVIATTRPLNLRNFGIGEFRRTFENITGNTRTIFVKQVIENLISGNFTWSENTIVIRSHKSSP